MYIVIEILNDLYRDRRPWPHCPALIECSVPEVGLCFQGLWRQLVPPLLQWCSPPNAELGVLGTAQMSDTNPSTGHKTENKKLLLNTQAPSTILDLRTGR